MRFITSTQEAIECYKRSLVGADPKESHVKEKLARLLAEVGDHAAAIEYHKLLVESEVADADGGSYWHLFSPRRSFTDRFIQPDLFAYISRVSWLLPGTICKKAGISKRRTIT